eukprot:jgi/Galph1/5985/GphlegSOOS_G4539.1
MSDRRKYPDSTNQFSSSQSSSVGRPSVVQDITGYSSNNQYGNPPAFYSLNNQSGLNAPSALRKPFYTGGQATSSVPPNVHDTTKNSFPYVSGSQPSLPPSNFNRLPLEEAETKNFPAVRPQHVSSGNIGATSVSSEAPQGASFTPDLSRLTLNQAQIASSASLQESSAHKSPIPATRASSGYMVSGEQRHQILPRPGLAPSLTSTQTNVPSQVRTGLPVTSDTLQLPRPDFSPTGISLRIRDGDISGNYLSSLSQAANDMRQSGSTVSNASVEATTNTAMNTFLPVTCSEEVFRPVHPKYMRFTIGMFPNAPNLRSKFPLPVGAVVQPLAEPFPGEPPIPVVNFGKAGIIRCRRCRAYINYLSMFIDGGRKFRCNFCGFLSDVPAEYYCPLDATNKRLDANQRPELTCGSVDFVAPSEYMVRPPMPPTYLFVIDVSASSVSCGALNSFIGSIRQSLDYLLGDDRTKVGLVTFDSTIHFYGLKSSTDNSTEKIEPYMAVVSDVNDVFIPFPEGCLVNLKDCLESLDTLLDRLETMFLGNKDSGGAVGPAVSAGYLLLQSHGGKMILMTSSKPSIGPGALSKNAQEGSERANQNCVGTDKEKQFLEPDSTFYKKTAVNMSRSQVSCDILLCTPSSGHFDLATLTPLAKYSGGEILFLSKFNPYKDYPRLVDSLRRIVSRETAWEGVLRIRCTRSVKCYGFLGRFFMRSTDLLTLPNTDADKAYAVEFVIEDNDIRTQAFAAQCAVLYTASCGERRVRIHTIAVPVTRNMADLYRYADIGSMTNLILRTCAESVLNKNFDNVRKDLVDLLVQSLVKYQQGNSQSASQYSAASISSTQMVLPEPLRLLPLCIQGLLKSTILCREACVAASMLLDDKSFLHSMIDTFSIRMSSSYLYPNIVPLFPLEEQKDAIRVGLPSADAPLSVYLPEGLRASAADVLHSHRVVLIDEGVALWIWIGSSVKQEFLQQLLNEASDTLGFIPNFSNSPISPELLARAFLQKPKTSYSSSASRAKAIVQCVQNCRYPWTPVQVVFQGDPLEARVLSLMVEDRTFSQPSYAEFLASIHRQVQPRLSGT